METTGSSGREMKDQARQAVQSGAQQAHESIDKMSEAARPRVDRLSESAHGMVDKMSGMASRMADKWSDRSVQWKDKQAQMLDDTRQRIREKPMAALAIAAAAGFMLRQLLGGRSHRARHQEQREAGDREMRR